MELGRVAARGGADNSDEVKFADAGAGDDAEKESSDAFVIVLLVLRTMELGLEEGRVGCSSAVASEASASLFHDANLASRSARRFASAAVRDNCIWTDMRDYCYP